MRTIHVLGCGNILKGDDGFGPAVVAYLENNYAWTKNITVLDAGLSCGKWIKGMNYDDERPDELIIIDVLDMNLDPGDIKVFSAGEIDLHQVGVSSHLFPGKFEIEELLDVGMKITFVSCQMEDIPNGIREDLSPPVEKAIPEVAAAVAKMCNMKMK